jgi:hypothetical protein
MTRREREKLNGIAGLLQVALPLMPADDTNSIELAELIDLATEQREQPKSPRVPIRAAQALLDGMVQA